MSVYVVGVDVSRAELVVAVHLPSGEMRTLGTFANAPEGWERLAHVLASLPSPGESATIHLVMEPTGGYEQPLARFAGRQGWRISLPNPRHVRDWARGMGRRAKTDRVDAEILAAYGAATTPPIWQPLPAEVEELEALLERRAELQEALQQERNRCHALKAQGRWQGAVAASLEAHLAFLEQALQELEQEIRNHLDRHPGLKEEVARLRQVPGIGARNCLPILVLLCRWRALTNNQGSAKGLTAYVGLDPVAYRSGTSVCRRSHISRQGNAIYRRLLFLGALGGVRGQNPLRTFYQRLVQRKKPKMVALVATARKLLVWAWAVFRDKTQFDPQRTNCTA